jgi:hypothetical protein
VHRRPLHRGACCGGGVRGGRGGRGEFQRGLSRGRQGTVTSCGSSGGKHARVLTLSTSPLPPQVFDAYANKLEKELGVKPKFLVQVRAPRGAVQSAAEPQPPARSSSLLLRRPAADPTRVPPSPPPSHPPLHPPRARSTRTSLSRARPPAAARSTATPSRATTTSAACPRTCSSSSSSPSGSCSRTRCAPVSGGPGRGEGIGPRHCPNACAGRPSLPACPTSASQTPLHPHSPGRCAPLGGCWACPRPSSSATPSPAPAWACASW